MNKCMGQFSGADMQILEDLIKTNFTDTMMINSLAQLQMAQIHLTEKINNSFSTSLNNYIHHQNQKFQEKQNIQNSETTQKGKKK